MIVTGAKIPGASDAQYEVQEFLGSGSFGSVYKVTPVGGGQTLALKILTQPSEKTDLATFLNEGQLAVGIRHHNVIRYDYFHDGETHTGLPPYILMEFADGGSLEDLLQGAVANGKAFSISKLRGMYKQLVAGMAAVNAKLVHRDIKPENILVCKSMLKIGDFGLAKLVAEATRTFTFKGWGSYPYIAPEGWRFEKNTIQLDIYALGVVFYQMATLRLPFDIRSADPQKWMEAHFYQPVTPPNKFNPRLGAQLSNLIMKMIEKATSKRFTEWSSIDQLLEAEEPSSETQKSLVNEMLQARLQQDSAAQAADAEASKKAQEKSEFSKLVIFQAEQTLIEPIRELLDDFNRQYPGKKSTLSGRSDTSRLSYVVDLPSGKRVTVNFEVLLAENFVREREINDFGRPIKRHEICVPKVNGRKIHGWGEIVASDRRGLNVLLLERAGEIYGEWFLLINTEGFFSAERSRPTPFAFGLDELEQEVGYIGVMHVNQMELKVFDVEQVKRFLIEYI